MRRSRALRLVLTICCWSVVRLDDAVDFQKNLPIETVWAVAGEEADLPCDVTPPTPADKLNMLMWFKDAVGIPLYSLDARGGDLSKAVHWAMSDDLGARSHFLVEPTSRLRVTDVSPSDQGVFRCRIDFLNSPTMNHRVNLTLVVPPSEVQIYDTEGHEIVEVAGPFLEGYDLQLACHVVGGSPQSIVTWWHDGVLIDSDSERISESGTVNRLYLTGLARRMHGAVLECQARPADKAKPIRKRITLEVFLKPLNAKIVTVIEMLSAGKSRQLVCESDGSFPPAKISWLLDGEPLRHAATVVVHGANSSRSTVTLRPDAEDDGKELVCRAENPNFAGSIQEDRRRVRVAYAPVVSVTVGSDVDTTALKEGDDARLICKTKANPPADKITWYQGGQLVSRNESASVLQLRDLRRASAGDYVCVAANAEGATRSRAISLRVQYVPVCKPGTESQVVGALRHETLQARCEVHADPGGVDLKFHWTYNKSRDVLPVPAARVVSQGHVSSLRYTPVSEADFGTLACWATNPIGQQKSPCIIHVLHAKPPDSPIDCHVVNSSSGRLEAGCTPGHDGGLPQHFVLEVVEVAPPPGAGQLSDQAASPPPLYRELGAAPRFALHSLQPGRQYTLRIAAKNSMGRSPPVSISPVSVGSAVQMLTRTDVSSAGPGLGAQQWGYVSTGILAALGLTLTSILLLASGVLCCRRRTRAPQREAARVLNNLAEKAPDLEASRVEDEGGGGDHEPR